MSPRPSARSKRDPLRLRPATLDDTRLLLAWRNERETRRQSFSSSPVPLAAHRKWLTAKLADPRIRLYIVEDGAARPLGQIRIEAGPRVAEVHIGLDPKARGQGVGRRALELAALRAHADLGAQRLVAHIKPDNVASAVTFLKAGFQFRKTVQVKGVASYRLERTAGRRP